MVKHIYLTVADDYPVSSPKEVYEAIELNRKLVKLMITNKVKAPEYFFDSKEIKAITKVAQELNKEK